MTEKQNYYNPIISGYYPDPSVVRVNDEFYLVNSSFEFFPGVPVFKSRNLVNWKQLGHCLTRKSQLDLENASPSNGILAPTIRYNNGKFYMITTNLTSMIRKGIGNFIVTADDPAGPWSDPIWIKHEGIDPSLFFDDDGKAYYCGTGFDEKGQAIVLFELDVNNGEVLSEKKSISYGCSGKCPEAPHIYKINGKYYLMLAEGGTEYGHMVTIQRADNIWGPYEACPYNPILTHRDFNNEPVQCVGHGDLFDDQNGNWWMVVLGTRNTDVRLHHFGRETFLVSVEWKDGWPYLPEKKVSLNSSANLPGKVEEKSYVFKTDFAEETIPFEFNYVRNPEIENYNWDFKNRCLILNGTDKGLSGGHHSPAFLGVRQKDFGGTVIAKIETSVSEGTKAGITVYYMDTHHYDIYITKKDDGLYAEINKSIYDLEAVVERVKISSENIYLKITSDKDYYRFYYSEDGERYEYLGRGMTAAMATEATEIMTFTGTYFGMFAENGSAVFKHFEYEWENSAEKEEFQKAMAYPDK